jgi:pantoate--beta-alanine ligase
MPPKVVTTHTALRAELGGASPGFVATMGGLHEGHASLIRRSAAENATTVVSIFVNPTQFSNPWDLAVYPRQLEADLDIAGAAGADMVYAPDRDEIYPSGFASSIDPGPLARSWEGGARPGHFQAVATVVAILLNSVLPKRAYFGEKDFQQLLVIRRMAKDLRIPVEIVGCPTVRDADGLALSSRNARLSPAERARARAIPKALFRMREMVEQGIDSSIETLSEVLPMLPPSKDFHVDYFAMVDPVELEPVVQAVPGTRAIVAVEVGSTRLIDNIELVPMNTESR